MEADISFSYEGKVPYEPTPMQAKTKKRVREWRDKIIHEKLDPWRFMGVSPRVRVDVTMRSGKPIHYQGGTFAGAPEMVFWSRAFIPPFLEDAIEGVLQETAAICRENGLPPEAYLAEAAAYLRGLIWDVYHEMGQIAGRLTGHNDGWERPDLFKEYVEPMLERTEDHRKAARLLAGHAKDAPNEHVQPRKLDELLRVTEKVNQGRRAFMVAYVRAERVKEDSESTDDDKRRANRQLGDALTAFWDADCSYTDSCSNPESIYQMLKSQATSDELEEVQRQARETEPAPASTRRFAIALSFPGERRLFVEQVASRLAEQIGRERVLYDKYHEAEFACIDLDTHLQRLYHDESELIAAFLCADYERKEWCGLEWRAIRDLIKGPRKSDVMLLRFDDTTIPGVYSIDGYVPIGTRPAYEIGDLILQRLGK